MKKVLILLVVLIITTVGVVLANIAKKQSAEEKIERLDFQSVKKTNDLSAWD